MNQPLISVNVLMYNSSKFIIETLESIKAQTYQNIEIIISDDKSTDNTVQICEDWIAKNKDRFASYKILVPEHNTGQSGNYNRAFHAATGEWIKEIDGDDLLLPNCLTDLVKYVTEHPESKYVFGHMKCFGADEDSRKRVMNFFDYSIFSKTSEEQLHRLLYKGNCIPSPASFYNRQFILELGFENDERIPFMEDWPKWINLIKLGVKFEYVPIDIVSYRVDSGISTGIPSERFVKTNTLMDAYYRYPAFYRNNIDEAVAKYVEFEMNHYRTEKRLRDELESVCNSTAFKVGNIVAAPFRLIKSILNRIKGR